MLYKGGCHCGKIAFEVEGFLEGVMLCNCSICVKKGYLLWFIPMKHMRLLTPPSNISTYTFYKHEIKHQFCAVCGCSPYGEGTNPKTKELTAAINVRCIEDLDLSKLKITNFDGKSL